MSRQASTRKTLLDRRRNVHKILGDESPTDSDDNESNSDGLFRSVSTVRSNRTFARDNSTARRQQNQSSSRQITENTRTPDSRIVTRSFSTTTQPRRQQRSPVASTSRQKSPVQSTSRRDPPATSTNAKKQGKTSRRKQAKPKRFKGVEKEIRRLQSNYNNLIPRLPFSRLFRELLADLASGRQLRITVDALQALQEASELYLTQLFADAYRCTLHRARVTLMPKDMDLVRYLRGPADPGN